MTPVDVLRAVRARLVPGRWCRKDRGSLAERFARKCDASGGPDACHRWLGAPDRHGYGSIRRAGRGSKNDRAHRVAAELAGRPIPVGLEARHLCGNRWCVNAKHIVPGTTADNAADRIAMGRNPKGETHPRARLTEEKVAEMRRLFLSGVATADIAARFEVNVATAYHAIRGFSWAHVPGAVDPLSDEERAKWKRPRKTALTDPRHLRGAA